MSLFDHSLDILSMEHLRFWGAIGGRGKLQRLGAIAPLASLLEQPLPII